MNETILEYDGRRVWYGMRGLFLREHAIDVWLEFLVFLERVERGD